VLKPPSGLRSQQGGRPDTSPGRSFQALIEHLGAHLQQQMGAFLGPLHLLLLNKALTTIWLTADSTKPDAIVSSLRQRSP
jgi:hypothetical protein